ncbi:MAG TPA: hypothetical protein VHH73_13515 [Verrucomicrobiae bacterium]|nr:hypothetical protein [Verrucomicrobiae bacterium]
MASRVKISIVSDIHYAGAAERARANYEARAVTSRILRGAAVAWRRYLWLRDPFAHNHRLDRYLPSIGDAGLVVANGDYSCDSAFIGVADDAALASARECLNRLRGAAGDRMLATIGDHELGKFSLFGGLGGLRLASWERCEKELGLRRFWRREIGNYVLLGVTSSLIALPVLQGETLPGELPLWEALRAAHLAEIRAAFGTLAPGQKVLLFCHDPTALWFLHEEPEIRAKLGQVEATVLGHLHSRQVMRASGWLAGMPRISFLGHTARRLSSALNRARCWRDFHAMLCPSLAGLEAFKDGGHWEFELDPEGRQPVTRRFCPMPWSDEGKRD